MKTFIVYTLVLAVAYGELPSNSYLPPPPSSAHNQGYSHGPASHNSQNFSPQVVAARSLEGAPKFGQHRTSGSASPGVNPFGRSSQAALPQNHAARGFSSNRYNNEEPAGYDNNAANFARNALEQINSEPANYNFGYMVNDYQEGTDFGHHEERQDEKAQGEYHVVLPDGRKQTVSYQADERGFKPQISYEDSEDLARSGYDGNANNVRSGNPTHNNFDHHGSFSGRSNGY